MIELRALKHKTRIPVEYGATLYGIMDETDTLEEDEIFCIMDTKSWQRKVIIGDRLIITRSPALHPGDVQLVSHLFSPFGHVGYCIWPVPAVFWFQKNF